MKIQTTRDHLLNKLIFISRALSTKISNFILNGIMLEAQKDILSIYGTDLETNIKCSLNVNVLKEGRVVVPLKILINVLRSFPEAKVEIEFLPDSSELSLTCQKANFRLNTFSLEEFPQFPEIKINKVNNVEYKIFKNLILKVQKSRSTDESRIMLTGILVEINNNLLKMVATDSYRLALAQSQLSNEYLKDLKEPIKVVVPERVLDTIAKSDIKSNEVGISLEESQIAFFLSEKEENKPQENKEDNKSEIKTEYNTLVVSRLLSGKFPDYEKLIPLEFKHSVVINRDSMLEVIKRVSSISQDNIPIKLEFEQGKLIVSMNIRETGSAFEELNVSYGEERLQIAFNPSFLIDGLTIMDEENLIFNIVDSLKPVLLKQEKNEDILYLLMPIRIS